MFSKELLEHLQVGSFLTITSYDYMSMFLKTFQVPFYKAENALRGDELLFTFKFCINQCLFRKVPNGIDDKGRMELINFIKIYQTLSPRPRL